MWLWTVRCQMFCVKYCIVTVWCQQGFLYVSPLLYGRISAWRTLQLIHSWYSGLMHLRFYACYPMTIHQRIAAETQKKCNSERHQQNLGMLIIATLGQNRKDSLLTRSRFNSTLLATAEKKHIYLLFSWVVFNPLQTSLAAQAFSKKEKKQFRIPRQ